VRPVLFDEPSRLTPTQRTILALLDIALPWPEPVQ
jgi:hypothetical protein